jgi:hypothetical protein
LDLAPAIDDDDPRHILTMVQRCRAIRRTYLFAEQVRVIDDTLGKYKQQVRVIDAKLRQCFVDFQADNIKDLVLFVGARTDPSADNNFAIQVPCHFGHTEIVKLLLDDARVDPSTRNNRALRISCNRGK